MPQSRPKPSKLKPSKLKPSNLKPSNPKPKPSKRRTQGAASKAAVAPQPFDPRQAAVADAALAQQIKTAARLAYAPAARKSPPTTAAAAVAAAAAAVAIKPGKERWPVKTGQDAGATQVGLKPGSTDHIIVDTTVEELVKIKRPKGMTDVLKDPKAFQSKRAGTTELTVWRITADVTAVKNEADGDLHLALQGGSGETMIAESTRPDPKFVGKHNPWLPHMQAVRSTIEGELRTALAGLSLAPDTDGKLVPLDSFEPSRLAAASLGAPVDAATALAQGLAFKAKIQPRKAQLTGVGFFDKVHGQLGVASFNGIELHPLLDFKWL